MFFPSENHAEILLTTSDYPPKLGGLSTFCIGIEACLKEMGIDYDLFVWKDLNQLRSHKEIKRKYKWCIHIHFMAGHVLKDFGQRHCNFIHGSEIVFTSPQWHKRLVKNLLKGQFIKYFEKSYFNFFISEFTKELLIKKGLHSRDDRDLVFHNCISLGDEKFVSKNLNEDEIRLTCFARDVPHKNLDGCFQFAKHLAKISSKKVVLNITCENRWVSQLVEIRDISGVENQKRDNIMRDSHFNLLLSLDHSKKGFFEGFGLTPLEAGRWGTPSIVFKSGGLPESVHHHKTGWVFDSLAPEKILEWWNDIHENYDSISKEVYRHTHSSHGLDHYKYLLEKVMEL